MSTILVIGATGTVGSALVPLLREQGHAVRLATRQPAATPEHVQLDLATGAGRTQAFEGVDRAFLLAPPGYLPQDAVLVPLIDEAARRGLEKVVLMTAMGADADESGGMRRAERALENSGLAYNIIRPNWFMQNFNTFWRQGIVDADEIALPVGAARGSFIDARDIAAVAARLLTDHAFDNHAFDLTGEEPLTHDDVAAILSREAGRTIRFRDIAPDAMLARLVDAGLPADYAQFLVVILGYFAQGYSERTTHAVQRITGAAPRRFADYAREHRASWAT